MRVLIPAVGQYDNIGDAMLRRQLLRWFRDEDDVHVLVGVAPVSFIEALEMPEHFIQHTNVRPFARAAMTKSQCSYICKPGEIQLTLRGMKEHVGMLPVMFAAKRSGGAVPRVGSGARSNALAARLLMRPALHLSGPIVWRDAVTRERLGVGSVMPDLAFAEGSKYDADLLQSSRGCTVLSLRGDRTMPPEPWLAMLASLARDNGDTLICVSQVRVDEANNRALARKLRCEYVPWNKAGHRAHELQVRRLYQQAAVVISDRLHVLVAATTEAASVVGVATDSERKIARHFEAAGLASSYRQVSDWGRDALTVRVHEARQEKLSLASLRATRQRIDSVREQVVDLVRKSAKFSQR